MGLATIAGDRSVAPGQRENARSAEHTAGLIQINVCFGRLPVIGNKQRRQPIRPSGLRRNCARTDSPLQVGSRWRGTRTKNRKIAV
jgi:hypothetical protein